MRIMVKLHDLVYLVEPPWGQIVDPSMLGLPKDEAMELDEEIKNQDEDIVGALISLGDTNLGLG